MDPRTLNKLLSTFEFHHRRNGEPEIYLEWRANLATRLSAKMGQEKGTKTATAILENKKLIEYLKSVMTLYRNNPALHREAEVLSDLPKKTEKFGSSKGLNYFVKPVNINRSEALSRHLGMVVQNLNVMPQGLSPFGPGLGLSNMSFRPLGMMGGGNNIDTTVKEMRNLYNQVLDTMKEQGKDLVEEDKKRIEKALSRIEENNREVVSALEDLRAFTRLDNALTNGLGSVEFSDISGSSRLPKLRATISNLENCVTRTTKDQVSLLSALVDQVYRPMLLVASGVQSPLIRAYGN
jgi:hypothetical protein